MSVERYAGRMELCCDDCGTTLALAPGSAPSALRVRQPRGASRIRNRLGLREFKSYAEDEFDVMIADAKEAGWRVTREESVWRHYCGDCAGERRTPGKLF